MPPHWSRARFPTPESLARLAGVAPSTRHSGKTRSGGFRWAADKQLRDAVCDVAGDSRRANPWAADLDQRALARGHDHPHAVPILARAWLDAIWHCWQDGVADDPARPKARQRILIQPRDSHLAARPFLWLRSRRRNPAPQRSRSQGALP